MWNRLVPRKLSGSGFGGFWDVQDWLVLCQVRIKQVQARSSQLSKIKKQATKFQNKKPTAHYNQLTAEGWV